MEKNLFFEVCAAINVHVRAYTRVHVFEHCLEKLFSSIHSVPATILQF